MGSPRCALHSHDPHSLCRLICACPYTIGCVSQLIVPIMVRCPGLTGLSIRHSHLDNTALTSACQLLGSRLHSLDLHGSSGFDDNGIKALAAYCTGLRRLRVSECVGPLSNAGVSAVVRHCRSLEFVEVTVGLGVTDAAFAELPEGCIVEWPQKEEGVDAEHLPELASGEEEHHQDMEGVPEEESASPSLSPKGTRSPKGKRSFNLRRSSFSSSFLSVDGRPAEEHAAAQGYSDFPEDSDGSAQRRSSVPGRRISFTTARDLSPMHRRGSAADAKKGHPMDGHMAAAAHAANAVKDMSPACSRPTAAIDAEALTADGASSRRSSTTSATASGEFRSQSGISFWSCVPCGRQVPQRVRRPASVHPGD